MRNIILMGPPASGKGTHSKMLSAEYGIPHISTGDLFRSEIERGTPLGKSIEHLMDGGLYVPLITTMAVLFMRIGRDDCKNGYILDGFPRTMNQAVFFDEFTEMSGDSYSIFELNVPTDILVERMIARSMNSNRADDNDNIFIKRLQVYETETRPVIDFFKEKNRLTVVDGTGTLSKVAEEIKSYLVEEKVTTKVLNFHK